MLIGKWKKIEDIQISTGIVPICFGIALGVIGIIASLAGAGGAEGASAVGASCIVAASGLIGFGILIRLFRRIEERLADIQRAIIGSAEEIKAYTMSNSSDKEDSV